MFRLVFQSGRYQGKRLVVRQAVTVVGRDADCHLVLPDDDRIAPRHARFEARGTGVFVSSLAADRPVERNGQPVLEPVRLAHGDLLVVGLTHLQYQDLIEAPAHLRVSSGCLQPFAVALAAATVALELLLLAYLFQWPAHLIRPDTEAADLAQAERLRAERAAEKAAETGTVAQTSAPSSGVVAMPGTAAIAPAPATTNGMAAGPATSAPPSPTVLPIVQMLDEAASFEPAQTNTPLETLPPVSAADPAIENAQRLLAEAVVAADFTEYDKAFRILDQILKETPGFLPAHVQRARLLEIRGDLDAAQETWSRVFDLAPADSPFHRQAIEQRQRLADLQALQARILQAPGGIDLANLPRHVRILTPAIRKVPPDADVAEMRILNGTLELAPDEKLFQNAVLQAFVTFYDADTNGQAQVTRAIATPSPLVLGAIADRRRIDFEATYVVPRGLRDQIQRETGRSLSFYGYTLHVFAGQILQDAYARPRKLLDLPLYFPDSTAAGP